MEFAVISPHIDDAAFSIAGILKRLVDLEHHVHIVNCFTQSSFVPFSKEERPMQGRRWKEDRAFVQALGPNANAEHLNFVDAPIRTGLGLRGITLQALSADTDIISTTAELKQAILSFCRFNPILLPLGLGNHRDHYISRQSAIGCLQHQQVALYEDMPYAARYSAKENAEEIERLSESLGLSLQPFTLWWDGVLAWKRAACSLYASQIGPASIERMLDYAASLHGERIWCTTEFACCMPLIGLACTGTRS